MRTALTLKAAGARDFPPRPAPLKVTGLRITPIALPDPPLLSAGGCHGPYFLRNIIEVETDAGIVGVGETHGGEAITASLEATRARVLGRNPFAHRALREALQDVPPAVYAGLELACLDACGRATGRRLCELLGGARAGGGGARQGPSLSRPRDVSKEQPAPARRRLHHAARRAGVEPDPVLSLSKPSTGLQLTT